MSKAVLISIQPKWCKRIADGEKIIEIRKTRPKIKTPFKVYIYCTKAEPYIVYGDRTDKIWVSMNGKVIGEFVCEKIYDCYADSNGLFDKATRKHLYGCCLNWTQIYEYTKGRLPLYGWHISDLFIYDEPKELSEFFIPCENPCENKLTRAPQSWCYVEG